MYQRYRDELEKLNREHLLRKMYALDRSTAREIEWQGQKCINFSSNDYLNLASYPQVLEAGINAASHFGSGARSSRLVTGNLTLHQELEELLADWSGFERVLLFPSGYQLNCTLLPAITRKTDIILADKQIHNSLITGCRLSQAKTYRFQHNDLNHLEDYLKKYNKSGSHIFIIIESLYSMDGDSPDLEALRQLSDNYGAFLIVDEAHALGVFGVEGKGLMGDSSGIAIKIGTFGKAFGGGGAFFATNNSMAEYLINRMSGFIYTTGLAPFLVGAALKSLEKIKGMDAERMALHQKAEVLNKWIEMKVGESISAKDSPIKPLLLDGEEQALLIQ